MVSAAAAAERDSLFTAVLKKTNAFFELPGVYEVSWVLFWMYNGFLGPLYAVMLFCWWVIEGATGKWWPCYNKPQPGQAILITGCDTGFGHDSALRFAGAGWTVYAGCLTDAGMKALADKRQGGKLIPVKMDVTKQADVDGVVRRLVDDGVALYAVINNAGLGRGGVVDWTPMEEYRRIMEVNFFSCVNVTKACLPLLKQSEGRIIMISSVAGFAAVPVMSAYAASKHALEAFSTALRVEAEPWGVKVVNINPAFHKTPITTTAVGSLEDAYRNLPPAEREAYGDDYFKAVFDLYSGFANGSWDPVHVVDRIIKATTLVDPMPHYLVGIDGRFGLTHLIYNVPLNLQFWFVRNTFFRKLIPQAVKNRGTSLPTIVSATNGNGGAR